MGAARNLTAAVVVAAAALAGSGCPNEGASASSAGRSGHAGHTPSTSADATTTTVVAPERLDVVAREYEWEGLPDVIPAGTYPMSFRNEGTEAHEVAIFRNTEGLTLHELAELGPERFKEHVEEVGTLITGAGTTAAEEKVITLTPGEYEVVCFIPSPARVTARGTSTTGCTGS